MARILVVEDEALLGWTLGRRLEMAGHDVVVVQTIADAEAEIGGRCPQVILLDLLLPDGHGLDLVARSRSRLEDTRIIVITAVSSAEVEQRALTLGVQQVLTKPVAHDALLELLQEQVQASAASSSEVGDIPQLD
jgi:DNA-binding response OmpR family regulator